MTGFVPGRDVFDCIALRGAMGREGDRAEAYYNISDGGRVVQRRMY